MKLFTRKKSPEIELTQEELYLKFLNKAINYLNERNHVFFWDTNDDNKPLIIDALKYAETRVSILKTACNHDESELAKKTEIPAEHLRMHLRNITHCDANCSSKDIALKSPIGIYDLQAALFFIEKADALKTFVHERINQMSQYQGASQW